MVYRVCVCAASLVGKERSKWMIGSYDRVENSSACRWTCEGGMFAVCSESHVCRWRKKNFGVTVSLCFWLFRGKAECLQKMLPRGEVVARCRSGIRNRNRHSQFWGWNKVVPVCGVLNLSNSYPTGIPWSKTQGIHKLDRFPHCVHAATAAAAIEEQPVRRLHWMELFSQKGCVW